MKSREEIIRCKPVDWIPDEVWLGNEPAGAGPEHIDGGFCDRWELCYGGGITYNGKVINAEFWTGKRTSIHITGNRLWVIEGRYSGKSDFWEYCINHSGMPGPPCISEKYRHKLEPERLEKILNTKIPNCKFWDMVQARAWEIIKEERNKR